MALLILSVEGYLCVCGQENIYFKKYYSLD